MMNILNCDPPIIRHHAHCQPDKVSFSVIISVDLHVKMVRTCTHNYDSDIWVVLFLHVPASRLSLIPHILQVIYGVCLTVRSLSCQRCVATQITKCRILVFVKRNRHLRTNFLHAHLSGRVWLTIVSSFRYEWSCNVYRFPCDKV